MNEEIKVGIIKRESGALQFVTIDNDGLPQYIGIGVDDDLVLGNDIIQAFESTPNEIMMATTVDMTSLAFYQLLAKLYSDKTDGAILTLKDIAASAFNHRK